MENTAFLSNDRLKISPRAYALALRNKVDVLKIVPTGPEDRIIENDILRAIEERNKPQAEETPVVPEAKEETAPVEEVTAEKATAPAEEVTAEEETAPEAEEDTTAEAASEVKEQAENTENTCEVSEEITEKEENGENAEENTEENTAENKEKAEEPDAAPKESAQEAPEAPVEEEKTEETAIVTAPVTAVANEEKKEESEVKTESSEKTFRSEDAYRHTDVIISQSENAPAATPITLEMSFDATAITSLRAKIKEHGEMMGLPSVTLNDMILFAVTKTLKKHKAVNAHFLEDKIRYFDGIHLGFAVDTERGPQTLTVFDADRLSLSSLSKITGALVRGVRAGGEVPEKNLRMGSFTVTNVGTLGVERFTPVLTEPQTGVLAVCALSHRVKVVQGEEVAYPCIPLALTFDPRAMSTANAAKFLRDLCVTLENFGLLLIK